MSANQHTDSPEHESSQDRELPRAIAPPMANGEVLFDAPWEGRVFGMAHALAEQGVFAWSTFQDSLIAVVREYDHDHANQTADAIPIDESTRPDSYPYYTLFEEALFRLLLKRRIVSTTELDEIVAAIHARPAGHDHDHDHHH